jgi:hypothetical protein
MTHAHATSARRHVRAKHRRLQAPPLADQIRRLDRIIVRLLAARRLLIIALHDQRTPQGTPCYREDEARDMTQTYTDAFGPIDGCDLALSIDRATRYRRPARRARGAGR